MSWNKKMKDTDFHNKYELNTNPAHGGTYIQKGSKPDTHSRYKFKEPSNLDNYEAEDECIDFEEAKTFIGKKVSNGQCYTITGIGFLGYPSTFKAIDSYGDVSYLSIAAVMQDGIWKVLN
jgi:hypothetical protein